MIKIQNKHPYIYILVYSCIFMKKTFLKWGKSIILSFNEDEQKINGIESGDVADLSDMVVIKKIKGSEE
ncbi:hypothetical protein LCGC14_1644060 [marine sediment metagenome]|uniref:Uncharacterized protein n=1 Tax=marine sediment metagenome TaxID=412755 RepID=A0A0F9HZI8_9ZZZZ